MQNHNQPVLRDIVLIGGGHSHVGVLRMFGMRPEPGVRVTLICTDAHTPYSGMLPGYIAGHYSYDEVHIDLPRLCSFAGARFYADEVVSIDRANKKIICKNRPPVPYDVASINIGSTPQVALVPGASEHAVPVKPIGQFNARWLALLDRVKNSDHAHRIAVVGAGAGGVELTLAMQWRLRHELQKLGRDPNALHFDLFSAGADILPTHNAAVRAKFSRVLQERGVTLHLNQAVSQVSHGVLQTASGQEHRFDEICWVTQAGGAPWLGTTGLQLDEGGFVRVSNTLQTLNDAAIFAAGDIASLHGKPLEKAGVFAVRMGKPLAENLRRAAIGIALQDWSPQRSWLALISTGDQHAIASRSASLETLGLPLSFSGDWVWKWKDAIDRRFMRKFSEFPAMDMSAAPKSTAKVQLTGEESQQAISAIAMRCGGCGAKVGATVLSRALGQLQPVDREDVLIGLHAPDDAAVVRVPPGHAMVHTVDFFRAFIDDPYRFGRVAANHALGDIFAMGATPQSATAVVTVPPGLESKVEDVLFQMMSGAVEVLNAAGCALVGGHTGEGQELALGFAINGTIPEALNKVMTKGSLKPGDALILTKPIGTGALFAAYPRMHKLPWMRGRWIEAALTSMQISNQRGAQILMQHGSLACTDLTGFGLLGHLVEMTKPSEVDAELFLSALPLLGGALECAANKVASSLAPANVRLRRAIRDQERWVSHPCYPLLFDPQTAGGLLASVPASQAEVCVAELKANGYSHTAVIGRIHAQGNALEPIVLSE
jgi:selenide, water dikinase